jgi:hypothetical protein
MKGGMYGIVPPWLQGHPVRCAALLQGTVDRSWGPLVRWLLTVTVVPHHAALAQCGIGRALYLIGVYGGGLVLSTG